MIIATSLKTYLEENNEDLDKAIAMIKQDGFDACGIVINQEIEHYMQMADKLNDSGLKFCVHSNMNDTNIASLNEGIRKESVKQVKDAILFGKKIDAIVNFHPGSFRNQFKVTEAYENMELSFMEIINFAKENDVRVVFENMEPGDKQLCVSVIQVKRVLDKFKDIGICLDIAHAAMITENYMEYWNEFKDRVGLIHISGFNGKNSHVEVSLKESLVDFSEFVRAVKDFKGIVRIENRERHKNLESLEFIKGVIS